MDGEITTCSRLSGRRVTGNIHAVGGVEAAVAGPCVCGSLSWAARGIRSQHQPRSYAAVMIQSFQANLVSLQATFG